MGENACISQAELEQGLEDGIGELWSTLEQFGGSAWVGHREALHLRQNVKELWYWECVQRA